MPPFAERVARAEEAVFRTFGEDATWAGLADPVRVIRREADEPLRLDYGETIVSGRMLRVRKSEVEAPAEGDEVQVLDADGAPVADAKFAVSGEPRLDRKGVWHCQIVLIA